MLFNSFGYLLLFLPLTVLAVAGLRRYAGGRATQAAVLVAATIFYGSFEARNLLHLAASILLNWLLARRMAQESGDARKRWLQFGLVLNLGYLCCFKYLDFLLSALPVPHGWLHAPHLAMPLGISFFTLTQVMYLVDNHEELVTPGTLFEHASFVSFFPYVLSGPLARSKRMRKQLEFEGGTNSALVARGMYLFSLGFFKKAVCAETFGKVSGYGFDVAQRRSALEVCVFTVAYSMQIYFDFSGYSDMAIGSAEMLGIQIPRNFDAPFRSKSIIEFWERWHISLSSFITTYLYTPIVRSFRRVTLGKAMLATMLAMSIAGLWHGPSWTFVAFGAMHGVGLAVNSLWRKRVKAKLPAWVSWALTFAFVNAAFLFFRAPTLGAASAMLGEIVHPRSLLSVSNLVEMRGVFSLPIFGPPIALGLVMAFYGKSSEQSARDFVPRWQTAVVSGLALVIAAVYTNSQISAAFLYFKF